MSESKNDSQRSPLTILTNSPGPTPASSPTRHHRDKSSASQIRRKQSFRARNANVDSSESEPSSNNSIYEASYSYSAENLEMVSFNSIVQQIRGGAEEPVLRSKTTSPRRPRLSGTGTVLDTIVEQKSTATMRNVAHQRPFPDIPRHLSLPQFDAPPYSTSPRLPVSYTRAARAKSMSEGAMHISRKYSRNLLKSSSSEDGEGVYLSTTDYAAPNLPLKDPPHRMPTPPGLSNNLWNSAYPRRHTTISQNRQTSAISEQTEVRPNRYSRFFSLGHGGTRIRLPTGISVTRNPTDTDANSRITSAPASSPSQTRQWRPPQSGYRSYGSLDLHPFHRAPIAATITQNQPRANRMVDEGEDIPLCARQQAEIFGETLDAPRQRTANTRISNHMANENGSSFNSHGVGSQAEIRLCPHTELNLGIVTPGPGHPNSPLDVGRKKEDCYRCIFNDKLAYCVQVLCCSYVGEDQDEDEQSIPVVNLSRSGSYSRIPVATADSQRVNGRANMNSRTLWSLPGQIEGGMVDEAVERAISTHSSSLIAQRMAQRHTLDLQSPNNHDIGDTRTLSTSRGDGTPSVQSQVQSKSTC
jgi:hypothetical protein